MFISVGIPLFRLMKFIEDFKGEMVVVVHRDHVIYPGFMNLFSKIDFKASYEKVDVKYENVKDSLLREVKNLL
jgi:hypothetical protein